eukprot:7043957-Alexandrium_andersonii.AAC.1
MSPSSSSPKLSTIVLSWGACDGPSARSSLGLVSRRTGLSRLRLPNAWPDSVRCGWHSSSTAP